MAIEINNSSLPYSLDAEQTVLGTIILDSSAINEVGAFLRAEQFHVGLHNKLFAVMSNMSIHNIPIDLVTVIDHCVREKVFDNQDEARGYLLKLAESVVNPSSVESYAKIIMEKSMIRSLMYACRDIFDLASTGAEVPSKIMDDAERRIYDLRGEREIGELTHIKPLLKEKLTELEEACRNPGAKNAGSLSSSFSDLDRKIYGLNPSDLILIAGRPGMGKTAFSLNIAVGAASKHPEKEIVVFSLEMSPLQLISRLISSEAKITTDEMRNGRIDQGAWKRIGETVDTLSRMNMYFNESSNVTIDKMKAMLRRRPNLGLVVIDYLQLMSTGRKDGNRTLEIGEITRNLKLMAKDLNVPVILASQLSRAAATRGKSEKKPVLTDLRDSGTIEQDADIVIFLHRDDHGDNPEAVIDNPDYNPNECECIVAKNRQGETGMFKLRWEPEYTKFSSIDYHHAP